MILFKCHSKDKKAEFKSIKEAVATTNMKSIVLLIDSLNFSVIENLSRIKNLIAFSR